MTRTYNFFIGQGRVIADNIIDTDANGKGHTSINRSPVHFFGKEFLCLCVDDRVTEFTDIKHLGSGYALRHQTLQGRVDNLGGFLVLGAHIAVRWGGGEDTR